MRLWAARLGPRSITWLIHAILKIFMAPTDKRPTNTSSIPACSHIITPVASKSEKSEIRETIVPICPTPVSTLQPNNKAARWRTLSWRTWWGKKSQSAFLETSKTGLNKYHLCNDLNCNTDSNTICTYIILYGTIEFQYVVCLQQANNFDETSDVNIDKYNVMCAYYNNSRHEQALQNYLWQQNITGHKVVTLFVNLLWVITSGRGSFF